MIIEHDVDKCAFTLFSDDNQEVGHIKYRVGDQGELRATHTKVYPQYNGKGYAGLLVDALVEYAESQDAKIVPVCSYIERRFDAHPERYASVRQ